MLILFYYDLNSIHVKLMPSGSGYYILLTYHRDHQLLVSRGLRPKLQKLDNECSVALVVYLDTEAVDFQLALPQVKRGKATERAMWKNHFIAVICGCNRNLPMNLWSKLVLQAILTLNLLRWSSLKPNLSVFA